MNEDTRTKIFEELLDTGLFDTRSEIEAAFLHQTTERMLQICVAAVQDEKRLLLERLLKHRLLFAVNGTSGVPISAIEHELALLDNEQQKLGGKNGNNIQSN